jgi:hypothetical protein
MVVGIIDIECSAETAASLGERDGLIVGPRTANEAGWMRRERVRDEKVGPLYRFPPNCQKMGRSGQVPFLLAEFGGDGA